MALPASGTISMNDIRVELGISTQAPFDIDTARSGGYVALNPYSPTLPPSTGTVSLASWYSYCHACTPLYSHTVYFLVNAKGIRRGFATKDDACAHTDATSATIYSSSSTLSVGSSLYFLDGGGYYPAIFSDFFGLWIWNAGTDEAILMTSSSSNVIDLVEACGVTYYYYTADYWVDCSGVTTYGVIIRSTVAIYLAWTRWGGTSGANYLNITGISGSTDWVYESDGTQNTYCGY
jgi:hypothetical protein